MNAYEIVLKSREKGRPTALKYIGSIVENFIELHGDRRFADDKAIVAGIGTISGMPVTVIGIEKGSDTHDKIAHNFGCAHPEGYRKAVRLMKEAEKFHRPVLCFVDTSGAYCGIGAEERGQSEAIAMSILDMIRLKTPTLTVITARAAAAARSGFPPRTKSGSRRPPPIRSFLPKGARPSFGRTVRRSPRLPSA